MAYLKSSNLLMACLLGTQASLFLVAPAQSEITNSQEKTSVHSLVEVEVVNLSINSSKSSEKQMLLAEEDVDRNQDLNQDLNQDVDRTQPPSLRRV